MKEIKDIDNLKVVERRVVFRNDVTIHQEIVNAAKDNWIVIKTFGGVQ